MDAADRELFERSVRQAIGREGDALDGPLAELGWVDALAEDPNAAVSVLFSLQGRSRSTSRALDHVVAAALNVPLADDEAVVLPALGRWAAPAELGDDGLSVRGLGTGALEGAARAVVVAERGGDAVVTTVLASALERRPVRGIDPDFGLVTVAADRVGADLVVEEAHRWEAAVARAQVAVGHELLGAARAMLDLARDHALDRVQYGQPVARFQAVRHRLAEALVAIEAADAAVTAAGAAPSAELAGVAKSLAGRGARVAARHAQQVLAGVGFTAEHPFHRYYRRVLLLDELFGSARALTAELGDRLLRSRRLPSLLPL